MLMTRRMIAFGVVLGCGVVRLRGGLVMLGGFLVMFYGHGSSPRDTGGNTPDVGTPSRPTLFHPHGIGEARGAVSARLGWRRRGFHCRDPRCLSSDLQITGRNASGFGDVPSCA
jgi:hypothetical protein